MGFKAISVPEVIINDETFRIVPNSFEYDGGEGEISVRSASAGAGNSESVHTENAEGQIGMCKFSLYLDNDLDGNIRDWKSNVGTNTIKATQINVNGAAFIRVFPGASLVNAVSRQAGADGVVEVEFKGDPMLIS